MSLRAKISKRFSKNFIDKFQQSLSLSAPIPDSSVPNAMISDIERLKLKDLMNTLLYDETNAGKDLKRELDSLKSLYYVNEIANKPEPQILKKEDYYNRGSEVNKKFEIKKVEGTKTSVRTGLLGYKVGMTMAWDKFGTCFPLTVVRIENCQVTQVKKADTDKYYALQLGAGHREPKRLTKGMVGHLIKNNIPPKKDIREFKVSPDNLLPVGYMLSVRHFKPGNFVDVTAKSIGKGFQGVMKRWNFKGLVATHGCSVKHRAAGSIGNREWPAKVWKGKKMAGQLGNERITTQNLLVFRTDYKRNLLFIKGAIPGRPDGLILIKDAVKKHDQWKKIDYPTFVEEKGKNYPNILEFEGTEDLNEKYTHDNDEVLGVSEEEEEGEPEKNADEEGAAKK